MATAHLHLPHLHVPHVGMPQDQAHRDGTRPSHRAGVILGIGFVVAIGAWLTALVALYDLGPIHNGSTPWVFAAWTAVAISSTISMFLMGIWKATRA